MDRSESPAYAVLPRMARRVFAAIELAISDGSSAHVSFFDFGVDHGISAKSVKPALTLLEQLGLIEIEVGPHGRNEFRFSDCWRGIDAGEAARLAALAKKPSPVKPPKPPQPKPRPKPPQPKPPVMTVPQPPVLRQVPSLPTMPWHDDGR